MSSPSLPDSKSLTEEILELADDAYHPMGTKADSDRLRARLESIESELTELREKEAFRNSQRISGRTARNVAVAVKLLNVRPVELGDEEGG